MDRQQWLAERRKGIGSSAAPIVCGLSPYRTPNVARRALKNWREAALLQSFPRSYQFWPPDKKLNRGAVSRMIGNAVPPRLAKALGRAIMEHIVAHESAR